MPPKKRSASQQLVLQQARDAHHTKSELKTIETGLQEQVLTFKSAVAQAEAENSVLETKVASYESQLEEAEVKNTSLEKKVDKFNKTISFLRAQLDHMTGLRKETYRALRNERRAHQRAIVRRDNLDQQLTDLKNAHFEDLQALENERVAKENVQSLLESNLKLKNTLLKSISSLSAELKCSSEKLNSTRTQLKQSKSQNYNLQRKQARAAMYREKAVQKAKNKVHQEKSTLNLLEKGVYSNETRNLVRTLVQANVSNSRIMEVITAVLAAAGIKPVGRITARTVGRIVKEGYIAACLQLGFELNNADAITLSSDGTSHKNLNYNSRHANYRVENPDGTEQQVTRFLGLERSLDGSSEQAVKEWDEQLENIYGYFNASPLAKETNSFGRLVEIYTKLAGMHSDHCAKEKKDFQLMAKKKKEMTYQILGAKRLQEDTVDELFPQFLAATNDMRNKEGGKEGWDRLTETEQNERKARMLTQLTIDLGKASFDKLSDQEQSVFKLFIWVGCGCHKDLNTVLGGYVALSKFWQINKLEPPVILPNKQNAAIIDEDPDDDNNSSEAVRKAVKNSTRGAVKAAKIAGDILNNKNDKAGHHDDFQIWWTAEFGEKITFPGTSNNRFGSNCDASTLLTMKREAFIKYMEYAEKKKGTGKRSNMEENFVKALNDVPTRTEFAVLAIYAQAVSYPYMQTIRGDPTTNALDLGPLNKKIASFIQRIIGDPTFLIGPNVTYETGTFNGEPWKSPDVVAHINKIAPELPHLKAAVVAFFQGALESWKRFTSEYAVGGLIDEATQEEKDVAWMPPTNDVNEGALGGFRVAIRRQPQLTLLQYNACAMFARNNTAKFMKENFSDETYKYIRKIARESDTREKNRLEAIVEHNKERIKIKEAAKQKRAECAIQVAAQIAKVKLNFNKEEVDKMKGDKLRDHFVAFKKAGAPVPDNIKRSSKVGELKEAIKNAIDSYEKGGWQRKDNIPDFSNAQEIIEEDDEEWIDITDEPEGSDTDE